MAYLAALTPRAGRWNHRYLVSPNCNRGSIELGKCFAAARIHSIGDEYISIRHTVQQPTTGRAGDEILVLADIDVTRMDEDKIKEIARKLESRLANLEQLILNAIDWEHEGKQGLLRRIELGEWLVEDFDGQASESEKIPPAQKEPGPVRKSNWRLIMTAIIGTVLLVTSGLLQDFVGGQGESVPPELCALFGYSGECKVTTADEEFLSLCDMFSIDRSSCQAQSIAEKRNALINDRFGDAELSSTFERYRSIGSLDWKAFFGEDLNTLGREQLYHDMGVSESDVRDATYDNFVELWKLKDSLKNAYWKIPEDCRRDVGAQDSAGAGSDAETTELFRNVKFVIKKIKENRTSPCVVGGIEPLKDCTIGNEFWLMEIIKSQCLNSAEVEKSRSTYEEQGRSNEVATLDALIAIFDLAPPQMSSRLLAPTQN